MREIKEETGQSIKKEDIIAKGDPEKVDRFLVHPFIVKANKEVVLDHENVDYRWVPINRFDQFNTVPRLKEIFKKTMENATGKNCEK